jgi:phytoene dehydrogenase-like protein
MPSSSVVATTGSLRELSARAGVRTLVLERRQVLGGAAVTEEVFPGFRMSVAST